MSALGTFRISKWKIGILVSLFIVLAILFKLQLIYVPNQVSYSQSIDEFKKSGVPDFALPRIEMSGQGYPNAEDSRYFLSASQSSLILVNFWASWCGPCKDEFPELLKLSGMFQKNELEIVAVSIDSEKETLIKFLELFDFQEFGNFITVWDQKGSVAASFGTVKIPESFLVRKDRKLIIKIISAPKWTSLQFVEFLRAQIRKKVQGQ